jgi:hypothetical protein
MRRNDVGRDIADLYFARAYLLSQLSSLEADLHGLATRCLAAMPEQPSAMRTLLAKFMVRRGSKPSHDWMPLARRIRTCRSHPPCLHCEERVNIHVIQLVVPGAMNRRLVTCPRCGVIEDAPVRIPFSIAMKAEGVIHILGAYPRSGWTAVALVEPKDRALSQAIEWPVTETGEPSQQLRLTPHLPPGVCSVALFFLWETHVAVFARMLRNPDTGTALGGKG